MRLGSLTNTSLATVQKAIDVAGPLDRASPAALATVKDTISDALNTFAVEQARLEALVDETGVGGVRPGMTPTAMVSTFLFQKDVVTDLSAIATARGYLARVGANIHNAPG